MKIGNLEYKVHQARNPDGSVAISAEAYIDGQLYAHTDDPVLAFNLWQVLKNGEPTVEN